MRAINKEAKSALGTSLEQVAALQSSVEQLQQEREMSKVELRAMDDEAKSALDTSLEKVAASEIVMELYRSTFFLVIIALLHCTTKAIIVESGVYYRGRDLNRTKPPKICLKPDLE